MNLFAREFADLSGKPRSLWLRAVFLGALVVSTLLFWNQTEGIPPGSQQAVLGRSLYLFFASVSYLLALVVVPAYAIGAIRDEREEGTLDLLLVSPLRDLEIIGQKVLARLVLFGLLLVAALPFTLVCTFLGGVSTYDLCFAFLRCVAAGSFAAAFALATSLRSSELKTVWVTYFLSLFLTPFVWLRHVRHPLVLPFAVFGMLLSGIPGIRALMLPFVSMGVGFLSPEPHPLRDVLSLLVCAFGSWHFGRAAARSLRARPETGEKGARRSERFSHGEKARAQRRAVLRSIAGGDTGAKDAAAPPRRLVARYAMNPVRSWLSRKFDDPFLDRSLRAPPTPFEDMFFFYGIVVLLLGMILLYNRVFFDASSAETFGVGSVPRELLETLLEIWVCVSALFALVRGATALSRAGRAGMIDVLRLSPLSGTAIVRGLALECLWILRWACLGSPVVLLIPAVMSHDPLLAVAPVTVVLGTLLGLHGFALCISLFSQHPRTSTSLALGTLFLPLLLLPLVENLVSRDTAAFLRWFDPLWIVARGTTTSALSTGLGWILLGIVGHLVAGSILDRKLGRSGRGTG